MKVGDKVVCIIDWSQWTLMGIKLKTGDIYTVRNIFDVYGEAYYNFVEVKNHISTCGNESGYHYSGFRKIQPKKEELINKEVAGIGIRRIERECEPSKITAPDRVLSFNEDF